VSEGVQGAPLHFDLPSTITVNFNLVGYKAAQSQGLLLLHHHNTNTRQAEVVPVIADFPHKVFIPIARNGTALQAVLSGENEVPPVVTTGSGLATMGYNPLTKKLTFSLSVANVTSTITAAHIHRGTPGVVGPVLYPLYSSTSGTPFAPGTPVIGTVTINPADEPALLSGGLYVNVHTAANPGGELRGQIMVLNE
jgi:hypothetical protein